MLNLSRIPIRKNIYCWQKPKADLKYYTRINPLLQKVTKRTYIYIYKSSIPLLSSIFQNLYMLLIISKQLLSCCFHRFHEIIDIGFDLKFPLTNVTFIYSLISINRGASLLKNKFKSLIWNFKYLGQLVFFFF